MRSVSRSKLWGIALQSRPRSSQARRRNVSYLCRPAHRRACRGRGSEQGRQRAGRQPDGRAVRGESVASAGSFSACRAVASRMPSRQQRRGRSAAEAVAQRVPQPVVMRRFARQDDVHIRGVQLAQRPVESHRRTFRIVVRPEIGMTTGIWSSNEHRHWWPPHQRDGRRRSPHGPR